MDIAPLTRAEIKLLLEHHGYPVDNDVLMEHIYRLIRIIERDGYGISFSEHENANSMVNQR